MANVRSTSQSLTWRGDIVKETMREAVLHGINLTMKACINQAKTVHAWHTRSAALEGAIGVVTFAEVSGEGAKGTWGAHDLKYALIHELGGTIVPVKAKALKIPQPDGTLRFVKSVTIPARPYLRPAADTEYPKLRQRIRAAYARFSQDIRPVDGGEGE